MSKWKRKSPPRNYVDPQMLKASVIEMQMEGEGMTETFAKYLVEIQERVLQFPRFNGYAPEVKQFLRDENLIRWARTGWRTIRADKNPFAYITQACHLNFLSALKKYFTRLKRDWETRRALQEQMRLENPGLDIPDWIERPYDECRDEMDRPFRDEMEESDHD